MKNLALLILILSNVCLQTHAAVPETIEQKMDSLRQLISTLDGEKKMPVYSELIRYSTGADDDTYRAAVLECLAATKQMNSPRAEGFAMNLRLIFFHNRNYRDSLAHYQPDYLQFYKKHELWEFFFSGHLIVVQDHFYAGETDQSLNAARLMYEEAKQAGFKPGIANALNAMALSYAARGMYDEAETAYRESIELSQNEDSSEPLFAAYSGLAWVLVSEKRYEEGITFCQQWEDAMKVFEKRQQKGAPNLLPKWLNLYLVSADLHTCLEQYDKAEAFCRQAAALPNATSPSSKILIYRQMWRLREARGQYSAALPLLDSILVLSQGRGDMMGVRTTTIDIAKVAYKAGDYRLSADSYRDLQALNDSLTTAEHLSEIDRLRTEYEVDKLEAQKQARENYLWLAGGIITLLAALLGVWIAYARRIRRKNLSLYHQIRELQEKDKQVEAVLLTTPEEQLSREMLLFRRVNEWMKTERPFTDPGLNRKGLADRLGTNEVYLADAIREATRMTFSAYITQLRLGYSLELLTGQPGLTFEAVAADSGLGSYSSFLRLFTKQYGITPSEYRRLSAVKEKKGNS